MSFKRIGNRMGLFDKDIASEYGLHAAVVDQELWQDACMRNNKENDGSVMRSAGKRWYRFDPEQLSNIFPYFSSDQIDKIIFEIEKKGLIMVWRGIETDYIWVTWEV